MQLNEITNLQQLHVHIREKLLKQNQQSQIDTPRGTQVCAYRGDAGLKCAIGHCIADEHYEPRFEGKTLNSEGEVPTRLKAALAASMPNLPMDEITLAYLNGAQQVHDQDTPRYWSERLALLMDTYRIYVA